jgi:UDP-N-acetylmuramoyl-tripeptide--D-alanyl-D-alanine ligase
VLGDMLELGDAAERFHRELGAPLAAAAVDCAFLVGDAMTALHQALPEACRGGWWRSADQAASALLDFLKPGDVVTVKGSYALGLGRIVDRLLAESARHGT